jgi:alpha-glucosidase
VAAGLRALRRCLRPDELHSAFNFDFLGSSWDARLLRRATDETLAEHVPVAAPATWVLCNHDVTRTVTRYGRVHTGFDFAAKSFGTPTDLAPCTRRARAVALLTLALPGAVHLYQGEELGLPECGIPRHRIQDPMDFRPGGTDPGRDGCRVPLPVGAGRAVQRARFADRALAAPARGPAGIRGGPPGRRPRLDADPLPKDAPAAPRRAGLRGRTAAPAARRARVLSSARADGLVCVVNLADEPAGLPAGADVLLAGGPVGLTTARPTHDQDRTA